MTDDNDEAIITRVLIFDLDQQPSQLAELIEKKHALIEAQFKDLEKAESELRKVNELGLYTAYLQDQLELCRNLQSQIDPSSIELHESFQSGATPG
jgi:hypothetical protein